MTNDLRTLLKAAMDAHRSQNLDEAERLGREVLSQDPEQIDALHLLGAIAHQRGDQAAAIAAISAAVARKPSSAALHRSLAHAYRAATDSAKAAEHYSRAIDLEPGDAKTHFSLAAILGEQGDFAGAALHGEHAVSLNPQDIKAHCLLAYALQSQNKLEDAAARYEQALTLDPRLAEAFNNLGLIYRTLGDLPRALANLEGALEIKPDYADAHYNRGLVLESLERLEEALASYTRATDLAPGHVDAQWNEGLLRLLFGDYARGWAKYEARARRGVTARVPTPPWTGETAPGKTLLIHTEQGFGDTIQFIRYVAAIRDRVGRMIVQCDPKLMRLLQSVSGVDQVIPRGEPVVFDIHLPLMSLPFIAGTTVQTIPTPIPYFQPAPADVEKWRNRLKPELNVGLVWRGDPANAIYARKIVPPDMLANILAAAPVNWVSLQIDAAPDELRALAASGGHIDDLGRELSDWADTAALVSSLDLVIAIDTAVAHLAGALGRPCWIMLPAIPDWRWLLERNDSPWYPSTTLFRQQTAGDWAPVLQDIQAELRAIVPRPRV